MAVLRLLKNHIQTTIICLVFLPFTVQSETSIYEDNFSDFSRYGDRMQIALPLGGFIGSLAIGDYEGSWQITKVMISNQIVVTGLKASIDRTRPDASKNNSFPSGHTSSSFAGAGFISHRYGGAWSIPVYTLASLVGISRVVANRHYLDDVMAGASIGTFNSIIFTTPYNPNNKFTILPAFEQDYFGVNLNYVLDGHRSYTQSSKNAQYTYQYELLIGATETQYNQFNAPTGSSDSSIDLADFDHEQQPANYAMAKLAIKLSPANTIEMQFVPFETRDEKKLDSNFTFDNETYTKDTTLVSSYRAYTLFAHWYYNLFHKTSWIVEPGVGIVWQYESMRFDNKEGGQLTNASTMYVWPEVFVRLGYKFTDSFSFEITGAGHRTNKNVENMRALAQLKYNINDQWMASLFYGQTRSKGKIMINSGNDEEEYSTKASFKHAGFSVGYSFD